MTKYPTDHIPYSQLYPDDSPARIAERERMRKWRLRRETPADRAFWRARGEKFAASLLASGEALLGYAAEKIGAAMISTSPKGAP